MDHSLFDNGSAASRWADISNMNELPNPDEILTALPRIRAGLDKYCWLQAHLGERDVSVDRQFQRAVRNGDTASSNSSSVTKPAPWNSLEP
jgi:hypothetical protein